MTSPSGSHALEREGGPAATRRPHVFGVGAQALPLPSSDSYTIADRSLARHHARRDRASRPGMLDEIEGVLICPPTRAAERQSYRSAFDDLFTIELAGRGSRTAVAQLIDLSADGIGFRVNADLDTDERIRIAGADLGELDGAEHMRRCRAQIEEIRRGLDASAGPLSPADVRGLPNGGMGTRSRRI